MLPGGSVADAGNGQRNWQLALTDNLLAESNRHLNQMYGLLESMDDGVMAWNEQGVLQFLNVQAARMLHLDAQVSQGKILAIW
jgi:transcriptional activator for dhaKLM operon